MNPYKEEIARRTNRHGARSLPEALKGAGAFIGVSVAGALTQDW